MITPREHQEMYEKLVSVSQLHTDLRSKDTSDLWDIAEKMLESDIHPAWRFCQED